MYTWGYSQNTTCNLESNNIYSLIKCWHIEDFWNSLRMLLKMLLGGGFVLFCFLSYRLNINWSCLPEMQLLVFVYKIVECDSEYTQATKHPLGQATQHLEGKILHWQIIISGVLLSSPLLAFCMCACACNTKTQICTTISFRMHPFLKQRQNNPTLSFCTL